jgi:formylglycine-generating enzyme required for sulfatase activity
MIGRIIKGTLVVVIASVLATLAINAGDNLNNVSGSLLGAVLGLQEDECPQGMVFVDTSGGGFCVDKYEASPSKECLYGSPNNQGETQSNLEHDGCIPVSKEDATPWRYVAQHQAVQACMKAGKRLPTAEEWYLAAMGTPDSAGEQICSIDMPKKASPDRTGEYASCISYAGAYDMVGNVWEWVDETVVDGVYRRTTLPQEGYVAAVGTDGVPTETSDNPNQSFNDDYFWIQTEGVRGMFRGGYWGLSDRAGLYSAYSVMSPSFVGTGLGFRCVK